MGSSRQRVPYHLTHPPTHPPTHPKQHAPIALGAAGTRVVIAETYARIFFRNCISTGEVGNPPTHPPSPHVLHTTRTASFSSTFPSTHPPTHPPLPSRSTPTNAPGSVCVRKSLQEMR